MAHFSISEKYFEETNRIVHEKTVRAQKVLQAQIFSQSLMENLINDLLDLAKMENNSFTFSKEYFNLGNSIYEAFQILISSANQNNIELVAEVDQLSNLDLIQEIYGDERRYKQIFLNFLSNSLKFTNKKGKITVFIKIVNQQIIQSHQVMSAEQSQEQILNLEQSEEQDVMEAIKLNWQAQKKPEQPAKEGQERYINI